MKSSFKHAREFYGLLSDKISKGIFESRYLYELSGNPKFIREMVMTNKEALDFNDVITRCKGPLLMYSAGVRGRRLVKVWNNVSWCAFIDENVELQNKIILGCHVLSVEDAFDSYSKACVIVPNRIGGDEIINHLIDVGFEKDNIINLANIWKNLTSRQYFDLENLRHRENEIFVDCGFFDGESSLSFAKWSRGEYNHIYAFEADELNIRKNRCEGFSIIDDNRLTIIRKGVYDKSGEIRFQNNNQMGSSIDERGDSLIKITTLDEELAGVPVSFIKMDIEGAELRALNGAKEIIERYSPNLAICIYHKPEDIFEIPFFFMTYKDRYSFFLRHYSFAENETVLYAIPKYL